MSTFSGASVSITMWDRHTGDRHKTIAIIAGAIIAVLSIYLLMGARSPEPRAPDEKPLAPLSLTPLPAVEAEVEPAPAPAPAPTPLQGKLHVASDPEAVVFEGTVRLGKTPLDLELDAGTHELRL